MNLKSLFCRDSDIADIAGKALSGKMLNREDGIALFESKNLLLIGALADELRKRKSGDVVTFVVNRHINYTNVCVSGCEFCAYYRKKGEPGAYTLSMPDIMKKIDESIDLGITELHIVGSHHPDLPFEFYVDMLERIHERYPGVHIQAFTAAEIEYFSEISGRSVREVLKTLENAGLDSLPGGGAEIFNEDLRKRICPNKVSGEGWIGVMKEAHGLGIKSNATMLFGHVETEEDRVDHLIRLREAQEDSGGFQGFIPLPFHPKNTALLRDGLVSETGPTGSDILKTIAISRIMLHGYIDNIRAYWVMTGKKLAQVSLHYGANDIDGTVIEENITHAAGANTEEFLPKSEIISMIQRAGRVPAQRTTTYEIVDSYEDRTDEI
jgi:aminodeoxyfutalosine synthase